MGLEKKEIDELFEKIYDIIDPPPKPPTGDEDKYEPIYLTTYKMVFGLVMIDFMI